MGSPSLRGIDLRSLSPGNGVWARTQSNKECIARGQTSGERGPRTTAKGEQAADAIIEDTFSEPVRYSANPSRYMGLCDDNAELWVTWTNLFPKCCTSAYIGQTSLILQGISLLVSIVISRCIGTLCFDFKTKFRTNSSESRSCANDNRRTFHNH